MKNNLHILDCEKARDAIQDRLDGPVPAETASALEAHLRGCNACREYGEEMATIGKALRNAPPMQLPDTILTQVWERTIDAENTRNAPVPRSLARIAMAAASLAAAVLVASLMLVPNNEPETALSPEMLRAARDLQTVLALTNGAITRSEQAAVDTVFRGQLTPTLRRFPVLNAPTYPAPATKETLR